MITVRRALPEDVGEIARMGLAFLETHPVGPYDEDYIYAFAAEMVLNHIALIADINGYLCGMILATEQHALFNPKVQTVQEIAWWVDEDARSAGVGGELLTAFESLIDGRPVCMGTMPTTAIEAAYFERRGWTLTHQIWTKGFSRAPVEPR